MRNRHTHNQRKSKGKEHWIRFREWRTHVRERQRVGSTVSHVMPEECDECTCLNCGYTFRGHNCPNCGQAASTQRITKKSALKNLFTTLIGGDSVFLRTCGNLMYRPGYMIRDFLCGKRTRYFRPVQMLLCLVTIYALFSLVFKDIIPINDFSSSNFDTVNTEETFAKASQMLSKFLSNTVAYSIAFAFIEVYPFKWLFRRCTIAWPDGERRPMNTAEYFFMLIYFSCLLILFDFVLTPVGWIPGTKGLMKALGYLLPILLPVWACKQMFEISWWKSLWRNIVASIICITFVICLLILYYGIFYGVSAIMK